MGISLKFVVYLFLFGCIVRDILSNPLDDTKQSGSPTDNNKDKHGGKKNAVIEIIPLLSAENEDDGTTQLISGDVETAVTLSQIQEGSDVTLPYFQEEIKAAKPQIQIESVASLPQINVESDATIHELLEESDTSLPLNQVGSDVTVQPIKVESDAALPQIIPESNAVIPKLQLAFDATYPTIQNNVEPDAALPKIQEAFTAMLQENQVSETKLPHFYLEYNNEFPHINEVTASKLPQINEADDSPSQQFHESNMFTSLHIPNLRIANPEDSISIYWGNRDDSFGRDIKTEPKNESKSKEETDHDYQSSLHGEKNFTELSSTITETPKNLANDSEDETIKKNLQSGSKPLNYEDYSSVSSDGDFVTDGIEFHKYGSDYDTGNSYDIFNYESDNYDNHGSHDAGVETDNNNPGVVDYGGDDYNQGELDYDVNNYNLGINNVFAGDLLKAKHRFER